MVSRFRLILWRWLARIHNRLHTVERMTMFYKVPHTETQFTSTAGNENIIYTSWDK